MILQALAAHYETLAKQDRIARPGWGMAKISYALEIDEDGTLLRVHSLKTEAARGKKTVMVPREMDMPAPVKRTVGVKSNFLWDNAAYLLGLDGKGNPERAKQCFNAAKTLHQRLLGGVDDPLARAICGFFETWDCAAAARHPALEECMDDLLSGANLTWMLGLQFPSGVPAVRQAWQREYDRTDETDEASVELRCLVTGELTAAQNIHPTIKGVQGAQSSGAALVSFNAPAFCSYEREQNLNAPVGKYAAFAYTAALNHLLADREHTQHIGDATVVYWAEDGEAAYQDCFGFMLGGGSTVTAQDLHGVINALAQGRSVDWDGLPLHPENKFYVLGLSPNAARISVRFFLQNTFGAFAEHLNAHYDRLSIVRPEFDREKSLTLWAALNETVNQNARDKNPSPQMAGDTLRAILTGGRYPATLYQQVQLRIRAERKFDWKRAAIVKAYLLRNTDDERYKEALTVKLNDQTTYQPYVLGRLFSVLEDIQQSANPGINATIKDKYFSSACATPAVVFPVLLNLAEKHLRKLEIGRKVNLSKQLGALTGMLRESYPAHHTLYEQGIFQLGYYHQTQKRYEKKEKKLEEGNENV